MPGVFNETEEKRLFTYPTIIEVRKGSNKNMLLIIIASLLIVTALVVFIIFK